MGPMTETCKTGFSFLFEKRTNKGCALVLWYLTFVQVPLKNDLKDRSYHIKELLENQRRQLIKSHCLVNSLIIPFIEAVMLSIWEVNG